MCITLDDAKKHFKRPQTLDQLAKNIRGLFHAVPDEKQKMPKALLLFGHNGLGKTRLSMEFKTQGGRGKSGDTLYYNAFTEDLFSWDNDLQNDEHRFLQLNSQSSFFWGLFGMDIEMKIYEFLRQHNATFDFSIDMAKGRISFSRKKGDREIRNIKISRGEERLFIWCFFLVILQFALEGLEDYSWVKYIYIDDPISSLDDNNVVSLACQLSELFKNEKNKNIPLIISTHHSLFYNTMHHELEKICLSYFFKIKNDKYKLIGSDDSPFLHHIALLAELKRAADKGKLYSYHFNVLRVILEKTAQFHGYKDFTECFGVSKNDKEVRKYARLLNLLSHGRHSLFEPLEMVQDNKENFKKVLDCFLASSRFDLNP